jgi:hypothetical protein
MAPAAGVIRRYGATLDRTSACYDTNKAVVVKITDACPCNFPVRASPAASLTKAMPHHASAALVVVVVIVIVIHHQLSITINHHQSSALIIISFASLLASASISSGIRHA